MKNTPAYFLTKPKKDCNHHCFCAIFEIYFLFIKNGLKASKNSDGYVIFDFAKKNGFYKFS